MKLSENVVDSVSVPRIVDRSAVVTASSVPGVIMSAGVIVSGVVSKGVEIVLLSDAEISAVAVTVGPIVEGSGCEVMISAGVICEMELGISL